MMLLASALLIAQVPAPHSVADSPERLAAIREVLDLQLVDYSSARFRDVRVVHRPSNKHITLAVCGLVNSRTRAGGYSGWSRFTILNDQLDIGDDALNRSRWAIWCEGEDVQVVDPDITDAVAPEPSA